jgi:hypothetical protein
MGDDKDKGLDNRVQIRLPELALKSMKRLADAMGTPLGTVCANAIEDFVLSEDFDRLMKTVEARQQETQQQ